MCLYEMLLYIDIYILDFCSKVLPNYLTFWNAYLKKLIKIIASEMYDFQFANSFGLILHQNSIPANPKLKTYESEEHLKS